MKKFAAAMLIILSAAVGLFLMAETPGEKKGYTTARVNPHPPAIDGRLDDPAWEDVAWAEGFVQRSPYEGQAPSEPTSFKILYDEKYIYVAVRALDSEPSEIERRMCRRDDSQGDWVDVAFDSFCDQRTAFVFGVNACGVKADYVLANDAYTDDSGEQDRSWDPIWNVKTVVDEEGWTAEMRIPFSQLRFDPSGGRVWGLQVSRRLFRKDEWSLWQPIPRDSPGWVHMFGELRGLDDIRPPRHIEVVPYTVAKVRSFRSIPGNPFASGGTQSLYGGIDGKIGVTNDLTLDFTVNPDFGQVEADPSVVNLTAFETYYQEKRPFFVEGRNILSFQIMGGDGDFSRDNLFYSRRIGRSPQYDPSGDYPGFVDRPEATSILGAFKLTGKTRGGLSIGILESVTSREQAGLFWDGASDSITVEPLTNYMGLRLQQDFNKGETILGGMFTATNRRTDPGTGHLRFLHDAAYTGGFDFSHTWRRKTWFFSANMIFSLVEGTPEALLRTQTSSTRYFQRPDATHVRLDPSRTSLFGHGGTVNFGKQGGGRFVFSLGATWRSPGLELNDMGYLRQADVALQYAWAGYRFYKPFSIFRNLSLNFNQWSGWNFAGMNIFNGGNVNCWGEFKNYWSGGFGINRNFASQSSSMLRGGPMLRMPGAWSLWGDIETDSRKKLRFTVQGQFMLRDAGFYDEISISPGIVYVPGRNVNVQLLPTFGRAANELQYITTASAEGEPRYVFARIDQTTVGLTVRFNYSVTPDLTVQFYGQPFLSAGEYGRFKVITEPQAVQPDDRYRVLGPGEIDFDEASATVTVTEANGSRVYSFGRPDFNFLQFRSNLVIRWEYVPGSTLFLVWSQGRTGTIPDGEFRFGRGMGDLFDVHPDNVFLVKFSYNFQL